MAISRMLRDLREARQLSQGKLAKRLHASSGTQIGRERISRWERPEGGVIPSDFWLEHLAQALDVPFSVLECEASLSRMDRRNFMRLTALTATHGGLASEMVSSIAGSDSGPLTTVQTTHGTDLVVASLADQACLGKLRRWMYDGSNPVLRVNAAGILAKVTGQDPAADVCRVLAHDHEARHLYMTAVTARVCGLDWATAERLAADPCSLPDKASLLAARFANEVTNPRDVGARWCSAVMLRDISPLIGKEPRHARDRSQER